MEEFATIDAAGRLVVPKAMRERLGLSQGIVTFVRPDKATYSQAAARCASVGLRSGAIYDALHLICAEAEQAALFLTFNERDFSRLAEAHSPRIVVPSDARPAL